jgi:Ca2+-binding EF-hand superfamily protein
MGTLDLIEFTTFLRNFAPGLKDYEIEAVFDKFDVNGDKNIDFKEFILKLQNGFEEG